MNQDCTLFFVHIPKAAGTTFHRIMDRQYPQWRIFVIGDNIPEERKRFKALSDQEKRNLLAVFGHMCYGWHQCMPESHECAYATILRGPIGRVISLYHYAYTSLHYLASAVKGMSLYDFVTSGVTCTVDNGMVRQLCGDDQFLCKPYADMVIPFGSVTREHLDKAKANLRQFAVIGTTGDFNDVLAQMRVKFGWRLAPYRNENITRWHQAASMITPEGLEATRQANLLDIELYEWVEAGRP